MSASVRVRAVRLSGPLGEPPQDVAADLAVEGRQQTDEQFDRFGTVDAADRLHHRPANGKNRRKRLQLAHPRQRRDRRMVALLAQGVGHGDQNRRAVVGRSEVVVDEPSELRCVSGFWTRGGRPQAARSGPAGFLAADFPFEEFLEQIADVAFVFPGQQCLVGRLSHLRVQVEELRSSQQFGVFDRRPVLQSLDRRDSPGDVAAVEFVLRRGKTVVAARRALRRRRQGERTPTESAAFRLSAA